MAIFYNQATLNLGQNSITSNITEGEITSGITMTKTAATSDYGRGDTVTYIVSLVNDGLSDITGVTITDNLGAYAPTVGADEVVPLSYVDGSVIYYQNGTLEPAPTVTAGDTLTIGNITIPAGGNATIVYEARVNGFAPLAQGSSVTNTVTLTGTEPLTDTATVPVREEVNLTISKSLCPEVVTDNGEVTYTFVIQNTGNLPVLATDNLTVTDVFNPILSGVTVTLDGTPLVEGTGYTYNAVTGEFATADGAIAVPAATYSTDAVGNVTVTPGFAVLVVKGTV